jgi:hypothetical protein
MIQLNRFDLERPIPEAVTYVLQRRPVLALEPMCDEHLNQIICSSPQGTIDQFSLGTDVETVLNAIAVHES